MVGELLDVKALREVDGAQVLGFLGEVDLSTAPALEKAIVTAVGELSGGTLVVDLTGITFLASAGMSALIAGREQAVAKSIEFVVTASQTGAAYRSLEIAGLIDVLAVRTA
nr:STAS domain-containing protein [Kibdelosporangium sp. MJ126-NF4]CEL14366.1 Anti-sigma F factor antagonist (spoIIAA-2); Anti-sigma B factor antagonist RsbV [Kibdelosporangium sp. MJ126-NF4]CTQ88732.1 Anti-sigma F factor antagonist (spoIIAA-2); Anti-sigma B factor antagonist RsbV [Kibdelosporangium sp. MJ126-NF4]